MSSVQNDSFGFAPIVSLRSVSFLRSPQSSSLSTAFLSLSGFPNIVLARFRSDLRRLTSRILASIPPFERPLIRLSNRPSHSSSVRLVRSSSYRFFPFLGVLLAEYSTPPSYFTVLSCFLGSRLTLHRITRCLDLSLSGNVSCREYEINVTELIS